jgi:hypothetical protein
MLAAPVTAQLPLGEGGLQWWSESAAPALHLRFDLRGANQPTCVGGQAQPIREPLAQAGG